MRPAAGQHCESESVVTAYEVFPADSFSATLELSELNTQHSWLVMICLSIGGVPTRISVSKTRESRIHNCMRRHHLTIRRMQGCSFPQGEPMASNSSHTRPNNQGRHSLCCSIDYTCSQLCWKVTDLIRGMHHNFKRSLAAELGWGIEALCSAASSCNKISASTPAGTGKDEWSSRVLSANNFHHFYRSLPSEDRCPKPWSTGLADRAATPRPTAPALL